MQKDVYLQYVYLPFACPWTVPVLTLKNYTHFSPGEDVPRTRQCNSGAFLG